MLNFELDFFDAPATSLSPSGPPPSAFDFLRRKSASKRAPIGLLTIKNAVITPDFLSKWQSATDGYKTTVIHVTFDNCTFDQARPQDICNFLFGFFRAMSLKIEGNVQSFLSHFFEDDRIERLQNIRIISREQLALQDELLLDRIFQPGALEVLELRKIQLSDTFVNKLIQRFRESTRSTKCINRLFLGGEIPWPLHQLNFQKQQRTSGERNKYQFKNRFGYYTLGIEYSNSEVDLRIHECF